MRQSHTAVIERNVTWQGRFELEPYEAGWAGEAIYFVRALRAENIPLGATMHVEISPDGIHWCPDGVELTLPTASEELTFCRVAHFGGLLRAVRQLPDDAQLTVIVYLVLKE